MKHAHRITLAVVVAALLAFVLWGSSCRSIERAAKSTGAGWSVAILALLTPAPWLALPVAALVGHVGGTIQAGDDIQEEATKAAEKAVVKYVDREVVKWRDREVTRWREYVPWWAWVAAVLLAIHYTLKLVFPRSRAQILRAIRDALTLKVGAALTRLGAADGLAHTDTAERVAQAASIRRRMRRGQAPIPPPPATSPTSQNAKETLPHDA